MFRLYFYLSQLPLIVLIFVWSATLRKEPVNLDFRLHGVHYRLSLTRHLVTITNLPTFEEALAKHKAWQSIVRQQLRAAIHDDKVDLPNMNDGPPLADIRTAFSYQLSFPILFAIASVVAVPAIIWNTRRKRALRQVGFDVFAENRMKQENGI